MLPQSNPEYAFFFADGGGVDVEGSNCPVTKECRRLEVPPFVLENELDRECIAECGGKTSAASSGGRGDTGGVHTAAAFFEELEPETLEEMMRLDMPSAASAASAAIPRLCETLLSLLLVVSIRSPGIGEFCRPILRDKASFSESSTPRLRTRLWPVCPSCLLCDFSSWTISTASAMPLVDFCAVGLDKAELVPLRGNGARSMRCEGNGTINSPVRWDGEAGTLRGEELLLPYDCVRNRGGAAKRSSSLLLEVKSMNDIFAKSEQERLLNSGAISL